jgi:hypothetical protein
MTTATTEALDLKAFPWPVLSGADMAFSSLRTDPALLEEAKRRGFDRHGPYNELFSNLFFSGGKLEWKKDLDPEFKKNAASYLRAFMGSFSPSHEDKEAICALLLSELVELPK